MGFPDYLYSIPNDIAPPVKTKVQDLPFNLLSWENFERLVLKYVEQLGTVDDCHLYGVAGEKQEGIDIFSQHYLEEKYSVYQCKRYEEYSASKVKIAIEVFENGEWFNRSKNFYICTSANLNKKSIIDEITKQKERLKKRGIFLYTLDKTKLSNELKRMPQVVYDFFGKEWTRLFCGEESLNIINNRLEPAQLNEYRKKLGSFYSTLFENHESSLRNLSGEKTTPKFIDRYIPPDINQNFSFDDFDKDNYNENTISPFEFFDDLDTDLESLREYSSVNSIKFTNIENRVSALDWLGNESNSLIVGGPGSGKSALLKYIVLGLLDQVKINNSNFIKSKSLLLPIWLPFGYWSNYLVLNPNSSLIDCLKSWFSSMDREDLWPLIETAINDNRLFLVVDGIDEWKSEQSALICLNKLAIFLSERNASSIISSRPSGVEKLGPTGLNWSAAYLQGLSTNQQKELVDNCIKYRLFHQLGEDRESLEFEFKKQSIELSSEILASQDLSELASVPLLLYMLIHLKSKSISLPHSRFSVYKELINDLIKVQPKRRKTAAQIVDDDNVFSESELFSIFSQLAYTMHVKHPHGSIEVSTAEALISEYLSDSKKEFGFIKRDAKKYAESFMVIGESDVGLLVKKSPNEVGFFHRALQEFLTSHYLFTQSDKEREADLKKYIWNNQWKEVFLGFVTLLERSSEVEALVKFVKNIRSEPYEVMRKETFLAEIAFGDNKCPAGSAKEIAETTFKIIQNSEYVYHKNDLINILMMGFNSNKLNSEIIIKLEDWSQTAIGSYSSIFSSINKHWPDDEITFEFLMKSLSLNETDEKRRIGRVISKKFEGDKKILSILNKKAKSTVNYDLRLVLFEVIIRGWPESKESKAIYNHLKNSSAPEIKILFIFYESLNGDIKAENKDELIKIIKNNEAYNWISLVEEIIELFYLDDEIKHELMQRVFENKGPFGFEFSLDVLLLNYYKDKEFLEAVLEDLRGERPKFLMRAHRQLNIDKLIESSPEIFTILENKIIEDLALGYQYFEFFKTNRMKKHLLNDALKGGNFRFWALDALIINWGANDEEVKNIFNKIIDDINIDHSVIAHLYPCFFEDNDVCFNKLLNLLKTNGVRRYDFIIKGIVKVANEEQCLIAIDSFQKIIENSNEENKVESDLVLLFGYNNSTSYIKKVALQNIIEKDGNIGLVASIYKNDIEIRKEILKKSDALPSLFKSEIINKLSPKNTNKDAWKLLGRYTYESELNIRINSTIGYCSSPLFKKMHENKEQYIDDLLRDVKSNTHYTDVKRHSAFCGLVALNKLDLLDGFIKQKEFRQLFPNYFIKPTESYWSYLAQNWGYVGDFLSVEDPNSKLDNEFFTNIGPHLTIDSVLKKEFIELLNSNELQFNDRVLIAASRIIPKDIFLFKFCLKIIGFKLHENDKVIPQNRGESLLALHILEQKFQGHLEAFDFLKKIYYFNLSHLDYFLTVAYSIGFEENKFIKNIKKKFNKKEVWLPTFFHVISTVTGNKNKLERIKECFNYLPNTPSQYSNYFCKVISKEINNSESLYKLILKNIRDEKTIQIKLQLLTLLISIKGLNSNLKLLAVETYCEQKRKHYSDSFYDVTSGEYKTSIEALTNVLYTY